MLLALMPVAAARLLLAGDDRWFIWGGRAYLVWIGIWLPIILTRRFHEGRRRGGVAEGLREALGGPGTGRRFAVVASLILALVLKRQYLRGTPWDAVSDIVLVVVLLGGIAWLVLKGPSEIALEGRASPAFLKACLLVLVCVFAFYLLFAAGTILGFIR